MDIAHDEVCSECHRRYPTSQFQHLALEEECFSTVQTVWATANLSSCPQCMPCGSQRKVLQCKAQCSSSWTRMFFLSVAMSVIVTGARATTSLWTFPLRSTGLRITFPHQPQTWPGDLEWCSTCCVPHRTDICFEQILLMQQWKDYRYHDLASAARSDGVQCTVSPIPVGQWQFHELAPLSRCVQACYSRSVLWSVGHSPMRILFCIYVCGVPVTAPVIARV